MYQVVESCCILLPIVVKKAVFGFVSDSNSGSTYGFDCDFDCDFDLSLKYNT
jgi:hypothetical protein